MEMFFQVKSNIKPGFWMTFAEFDCFNAKHFLKIFSGGNFTMISC